MYVGTYCNARRSSCCIVRFQHWWQRADSGLDYGNGVFVLLRLAHRVRHNAPDASHSFSAVAHVEEIKPAGSLQLW
jgi:hypothetical protein